MQHLGQGVLHGLPLAALSMSIAARLVVLLAILVALGASHWKAYTSGKNAERLSWIEKTQEANEDARETERINRASKEKALEARTKEILANVAAADRARTADERLRNTSTSAVQAARDTPAACPDITASISELFGECRAEVRRLGQAADAHAADAKALIDAWPR